MSLSMIFWKDRWYDCFFSSRRRHTRLQGDWSSDVCSSDLAPPPRPRDGLSSRRSRPVGALELPRVGAGGASDRHPLDRSPITMATATAQTTDTPARRELERRMLRQMLLIRRFEEKAAEAYALGKVGGFCHLYIGQ